MLHMAAPGLRGKFELADWQEGLKFIWRLNYEYTKVECPALPCVDIVLSEGRDYDPDLHSEGHL